MSGLKFFKWGKSRDATGKKGSFPLTKPGDLCFTMAVTGGGEKIRSTHLGRWVREGYSVMKMCRSFLVVLGVGVVISAMGDPSWSQPQAFEGGRVVRMDERSEDMGFGNFSDEDTADVEDGSLPWIPLLSPTMICLDCWITKTLKIQDFYQQQAAQEYFAHSYSCADLVLCPDPCVGTALKYTILAPIYAIRPHLLLQNCSICGIGNPYGVSDPIPTVAVDGPGGPKLLPPPSSSSDLPSVMPEMNSESLPPPPLESVPMSQKSTPPAGISPPRTAQGSQWSNMDDAQILNHFGLNGSQSGSSAVALEAPTSPSSDWEFADQAPSTSPEALVAQIEPARKNKVQAKKDGVEQESQVFGLKSKGSESKREAEEKRFSVTDEEYDMMRNIEQSLLSGSER